METTPGTEKIRLENTNILSRFRTLRSSTSGACCKSPKLLFERPRSLHYLEPCREPLKAERLMIDPIRAETQSMRKCLVSPRTHRVGGKNARGKSRVEDAGARVPGHLSFCVTQGGHTISARG